jgi:hypothetical protein
MAGKLVLSTLNDSSGVLATQNGMTGICKAWVNFNGVTGAIRGSFNISSITQISGATYEVNYTTAMSNANYSIVTSCALDSGSNNYAMIANIGATGTTNAPTTSNARITQRVFNNSGIDTYQTYYVYVAIFGA